MTGRCGDAWRGKSSVEVRGEVLMLVQHSSVPPAHTGIGIMSQIIQSIEEHPFEPTVSPSLTQPNGAN